MNIEYKKFWTEYTSKYGSKTAIFLQVGSFYEFYDVQDQETKQSEMNVKEIVDFLGIQLTIKKGESSDGKDILFAGFPDYVLHKWAGKLTAAGWTVIVVNQIKDKQGKVKERKVARILTPGSHIEALSGSDAPIIAALWIVPSADGPPSFGAATFDLSTGSNYITSGIMKGTSDAYSSDELLHFLSVFSPRELLIFWKSASEKQIPSEDILRKQFDYISKSNIMHIRWAGNQGNLEKPVIREEFLRKLFNPRSILNIRTYLSLKTDNDYEERALCSLLRFVEDYLPSSFEQLQQTIRWSSDSLLLMGNHALSQLQILGDDNGVLALFDSTATTSFSKRALKTRLLTPSANPATINRNLTEIDNMLRLSEEKQKELYRNLRVIYDIPRLHRKMLCAEVKEAEINALYYSYLGSDGLFKELDMDRSYATKCMEVLGECFDLERAADPSPSKSYTFLHAKDHPKIAEIEASIKEIEDSLEAYLDILRKMCNGSPQNIRKEEGDKVPYKITGTKSILSVLNGAKTTDAGKALMQPLTGNQKNFGITMKASGGVIDSPFIEECNSKLLYLRQRLDTQLAIELPDVCMRFCNETQDKWMELEHLVASIDISLGLATEAKKRNWCRPIIVETGSTSNLKATGLRHPLIEGLLQKTRYISHDVSLGADSEANGWLVYGMNASGKSSLMKSIGIAVHLAQAGCYVPAQSFELVPYRSLFTRILNQDNLWAGLSSFAVEMSEMRDILRAADGYTLVLGDELCSGTESVSAKALVAAGIEWLSERKSSYVFATHLHGLTDVLPDPSSISLKVWHLKVTTDPFTGKLIYHRNLEPGSGSSLYGLEVAKAMDVPVKFLDKAHQIRRRLLGTAAEEDAPRSAWNNTIIRRSCELCGSSEVKGLEVHHIKPRSEGGDNHASNLMVLCEACHDRHHAAPEVSKASVQLVETSDGLERIVPSEVKKERSIQNEDELILIKDMIESFPKLSAKQIAFRLKSLHNISISEWKIRQLKK